MTNSNTSTADDSVVQSIVAMMRAGQVPAALGAAQRALAGGMDSDSLLAITGALAWQSRDPNAAIAPLRLLLSRHPDDRATRKNLAAALTEAAAYHDVEELLQPLAGDESADRLRAFAAQQTGNFDLAVQLYRSLVSLHPEDAGAWNNLGNAYAAIQAVDDAIPAFEQAITLQPEDARIYINLAQVLARGDRRVARLRVMRDAVERAPNDPEIMLELGLAQALLGLLDDAEATFNRVVDLAPTWPAGYLELGMFLETRNKLVELQALAERARSHIGSEASFLSAWASLRDRQFDAAAKFGAEIPNTVSPVRRLHLLAQIADRRDNAAEAFALFDQMNAAAVALAPPPVAGPTYRQRVIADTAALIAQNRADPVATEGDASMPTFIVGFPRSGTTLLDTMLGALPDTLVLEERPLMATVERQLQRSSDALTIDDNASRELRALYFDILGKLEPEFTSGRLIDKHPLHMARMPLLYRLFPDAPVLLVERHPYDVVLSCFMANFEPNYAMRSFTTLDDAARTYDAVFSAWTAAEERLPLNVHRVRYERLVANPAEELRALLEFLKIDAEPDAIDHQTAVRDRAPIRTASYSQVMEPIYKRAVARWRRYADQLAPVLPLLRPWAERLGYEVN